MSILVRHIKDFTPLDGVTQGINRIAIVTELKVAGAIEKGAALTEALMDRIKLVNYTPRRVRLSFLDDKGTTWDLVLCPNDDLVNTTCLIISEVISEKEKVNG